MRAEEVVSELLTWRQPRGGGLRELLASLAAGFPRHEHKAVWVLATSRAPPAALRRRPGHQPLVDSGCERFCCIPRCRRRAAARGPPGLPAPAVDVAPVAQQVRQPALQDSQAAAAAQAHGGATGAPARLAPPPPRAAAIADPAPPPPPQRPTPGAPTRPAQPQAQPSAATGQAAIAQAHGGATGAPAGHAPPPRAAAAEGPAPPFELKGEMAQQTCLAKAAAKAAGRNGPQPSQPKAQQRAPAPASAVEPAPPFRPPAKQGAPAPAAAAGPAWPPEPSGPQAGQPAPVPAAVAGLVAPPQQWDHDIKWWWDGWRRGWEGAVQWQ